MTFQDQFLEALFYNGYDASIVVTSGTNCPCAEKYGTYSPEWHADHPAAENCNGTLKISETVTTYHIKAIFQNKIESLATYLRNFNFSEIGKLTDYDLLMIGTVNVSDMSFFNLHELDSDPDIIRYNVTINIDSKSYIINHIYDIRADVLVGQVALLKQKS